jgi:hypothetical protein
VEIKRLGQQLIFSSTIFVAQNLRKEHAVDLYDFFMLTMLSNHGTI